VTAGKPTMVYLGLEPYRERYTEFLADWVAARWSGRFDLRPVLGDREGLRAIDTGRVLDAFGRSRWAMNQTAELLDAIEAGLRPDVVYVEDLFHPGLEAIAYAHNQVGDWDPLIVARCWAQSVDVHDFTHEMLPWMRHYERMAFSICERVFVGARVHAEEIACACLDLEQDAVVTPVGLPFDADHVRDVAAVGVEDDRACTILAEFLKHIDCAPYVVYSSRLDPEKNPGFFVDVARELRARHGIHCIVCSGSASPPADAVAAIAEAGITHAMGLRKFDYYALLSHAAAHLNTASQDYVSYTLLEASALGVPTVAPAYKSFPEVLDSNPDRLYVPWSVSDAVEKVAAIVRGGRGDAFHEATAAPAAWHHRSLDRVSDLILRDLR
jgi:glycosyltransferase involved in cell wall biosynthesis